MDEGWEPAHRVVVGCIGFMQWASGEAKAEGAIRHFLIDNTHGFQNAWLCHDGRWCLHRACAGGLDCHLFCQGEECA